MIDALIDALVDALIKALINALIVVLIKIIGFIDKLNLECSKCGLDWVCWLRFPWFFSQGMDEFKIILKQLLS